MSLSFGIITDLLDQEKCLFVNYKQAFFCSKNLYWPNKAIVLLYGVLINADIDPWYGPFVTPITAS